MIYIRNAGYDSNVYHCGGENQVEDYTATAGPGMTVYFNLRRKLVCSASGSAQYVYFLETKRERTWNFYGQAEVALLLNRFFLSFGGLGSDARERWDTEIDIRPRRLFFDSLSEARKDFKGWVGDTSLSLRLGRRLALRAVLRRDVRFSFWYDNTFFIENFVSAGASTYFWRLRFDYDYSQGQNRYPGSRGLEAAGTRPSERRRDDFFIHSLGVYFRLRKNLAVGLVGQCWRRDSNLPWKNDTRDFFGLNLTYDF